MKDLVLQFLVRNWDTFIFGTKVATNFGVILRGRGPHKPAFAYDIVCTHYFMIYTDLIEYKALGDTKIPLPRIFFFHSRLKAGDKTTGQHMNYQTSSNLQFRPLPKIFFPSMHFSLGDTSREKIHLYLSESTVLF